MTGFQLLEDTSNGSLESYVAGHLWWHIRGSGVLSDELIEHPDRSVVLAVGIAHGEDALVEVATKREESGDLVGAARWYTAASWMFGRGGMTAARSTDLLYHSCDLMMRHDPKPNTRDAQFEIKVREPRPTQPTLR